MKTKKSKEDGQYYCAMEEAVTEYKETIKLRENNKPAKELRKICNEVNISFMRKHSRNITRGSVQRYHQEYIDTPNINISRIMFLPKVPGPKQKVPSVLLKALKVYTSTM